jgi:dTDP-4-dehydrorhamnose 3,5-epimerase
MKIHDTKIDDLKILETPSFKDDRGFFTESFNSAKFRDLGFKNKFIQDNLSFSEQFVLRGLHYQKDPDQAKLVRCISGKILDVVVDIRKNSKSYGEHFTVELTGDNNMMLLVPAGFAHGFSVLSDEGAYVSYKVDGLYNPEGEGGIIYNDPTLNIDWRVKSPILSDKDKVLPTFEEYSASPKFI